MRISITATSSFAFLLVCGIAFAQGTAPRGQQPARPASQNATSASQRGAQQNTAKYPIVSTSSEDELFGRPARVGNDEVIDKTLRGQLKLQRLIGPITTNTVNRGVNFLRVQDTKAASTRAAVAWPVGSM